MLSAFTAGALFVSSLGSSLTGAPATGWRATPPPRQEMTIKVVTANGSGCPGKSAIIDVAPDNRAFTVSYSEFTAQVGPQAKPTDYRKNCQLMLNVLVPSGFTYAIAGADYRGFGHLEEGAYGSQTAFYYFQGWPQTGKSRTDFNGWFDDDWQHSDKIEIGALNYLPCGSLRNLNVNTELRVNAGTSDRKSTSFLTMDSSDGSLETTYHVAWQKC
ncbi:DUF4360 domain-containing protein [Actinoplanes sp. NPDC051851]|uniref:DUF4360 domain-containing protein n=1 Tax=Actinoplanes sp. NPDC051851 TaxID=3154753 RepID=UPI003422A1DA